MREKRPDIMIYRHPNPEIRSFMTSSEISSFRVEIFGASETDAKEARLETLGTIGGHVVRAVLAIPGVKQVQVKPRELRVTKIPSASWDSIEEKILHALDAAFRRKSLRVLRRRNGPAVPPGPR